MKDGVRAEHPRNSAGLEPQVTTARAPSGLSCLSGFVR
jgi:hypothetical protein